MFEKHVVVVVVGRKESEESQILYILPPGAKSCRLFVKRNLQVFIGQSFIILRFVHNAHDMHTVYFNITQHTENLSRFSKIR